MWYSFTLRFFTFCIATLGCLQSLSAQEWSADLYLGAFNYQGDLVEGIVATQETQPAIGVSLKYLVFKDIAFRASVIAGKISGDDANSTQLAPRGLSFETNLIEFSLTGEYHPLGKGRWNIRNELIKSISPYVFVGVAYSFGDPMVNGLDNNSADFLNDQNSRVAIPFGLGVQWTFSEQFYIGIEGGTRYLFDDYIDGVSVSGNPDANDWYLTGGIRFGYFLSGEPSMF